MQEHKIRQDLYHRTTKILDLPNIHGKPVIVKTFTESELIQSIVGYMTQPCEELIYPSKSYAVALIYSKLIEFDFGVPFLVALDDPGLLYNNDKFFIPYSEAKNIYNKVIDVVVPLIRPELPQIAATIQYFKKEFLISHL